MKTDLLDLRNCDNMEMMSQFEDNYFDLAIVDAPYGVKEDGKKNHSRGLLAAATKYIEKNWDKEPHSYEFFKELQRVSKNQIIWGANHFADKLPCPASPCWIVWNKHTNGDFADAELAYTSFKTAVRVFDFVWNGMLQGDMKNKEKRIHPTQKPVALYKWLLSKYANPGDKILDTNLGSGSIAIACHYAGHHLTACELDEDYFNEACERIERETNQFEFLF